uniref:PsbP C-terminal domain-containing protein n=1 Tax=Lotharella globosa TaxID=91324 RepID=A0A7S4DXZ3_9EUKA
MFAKTPSLAVNTHLMKRISSQHRCSAQDNNNRIASRKEGLPRRTFLSLGTLLLYGPSLTPSKASASEGEPFYFDFDDGHLAVLIPYGYEKLEETEAQQTELPAYLMTPDAVAQRELKRKSFARLRNDRTQSTIVFTTTPCSSFKITFTRVNDIVDYGSIEELGKRVIPPEARNLRMKVKTETFPEKQTVRGPITPPPRHYYRYDFTTPDGLDRIIINLAVVKGFVYTMTTTCPMSYWKDEESLILDSVDTMTVA